MSKKTKIPQVWCDTGFDVFKDCGKEIVARDLEASIKSILPVLKDINNIQDRVSEHINRNVFMALRHYYDDMTFLAEDSGQSCGGKVIIGPASDSGEFLTRYNLETQIVEDLAEPMALDYDARESWIKFLEKAANKLRKANKRDYPLGGAK